MKMKRGTTDEHGLDTRKDLTVSAVDRQNILNNPYALQEIEKAAEIKGIGEICVWHFFTAGCSGYKSTIRKIMHEAKPPATEAGHPLQDQLMRRRKRKAAAKRQTMPMRAIGQYCGISSSAVAPSRKTRREMIRK